MPPEPLQQEGRLLYKFITGTDGNTECRYDRNNSDVNYFSLFVVKKMLEETIEKDKQVVKLNSMKVGVKRPVLTSKAKTEANHALRLIERTLAVANETLKKEAMEAYNREKGIKAITGQAQASAVDKLLKKA